MMGGGGEIVGQLQKALQEPRLPIKAVVGQNRLR
jgi:hypothetical protein